jgi:hypothetical protein
MKLFITKHSEHVQARIRSAESSAAAAMLRKTGWRNYLAAIPPDGILCEFMRPEWDEPLLSLKRNLNAAMNVNGLYWRPFEKPVRVLIEQPKEEKP